MQQPTFSLSALPSRVSYPAMSASASSPFPSFPDAATFSFPSKSSLSLSRQASVDPSFLFSSSFPALSRQVSLSDPFDSDAFNFPLEADSPFKAEAESFDDISRVSSFDSEVSWSSGEDSYSAPRSPQSSVDSLSDSSQSDAELYQPYSSPASYPVQEHWVQPLFKAERPLKTEEAQSTVVRPQLHNSPVPVLPLPFHQPVYAFNYHSAEDEPTPQPQSSRNERREGLRGGGDSRAEQQRSAYLHQLRTDSDLYAASAASAQPSTAASASAASSDAISPKSLLLSLSRTSASTTPSQSSQHSHHFSPSSSSSSSSSQSVTAIHLDPNEVVIGIYTRAERQAKIARYREKRANRQWQKKILYGCRKSFADNRPRIGGRFIKMKTAEGEDAKTGAK